MARSSIRAVAAGSPWPAREDRFLLRLLQASVLLTGILLLTGPAAAQNPPPLIALGDAVTTGFSGTLPPDPAAARPPGKTIADLTFINPDGISARILDVGRAGAPWNAAVIETPSRLDLPAKTIGQVFGIALDDAQAPNAYLAATSAFGLAIVGRGPDGLPERRRQGGPGTAWMAGQFGLDLSGGPGSIYRVDGITGEVSLFAEVMLNGAANPGPALGNLAYDGVHRQLFASDLHTGMVHRFSVDDGTERGTPFDHGAAGRAAARLRPVPFDGANRPNIASPRFRAEDPRTWGFAPPARRVFALAVQDGRLFYSANNGAEAEAPQIWSVGFTREGAFADDARLELTLPATPGPYPVTDIVFSRKGAMILAQRAPPAASWAFTAFTQPGEPRVLRYTLETPDDPATPSRWIAEPGEYAVGFAGTYRNANGGVDLGYGYGPDGTLVTGAGCEYTLWATGQKLRDAPDLRQRLESGGPLLVDGLQASPSGPVRAFNAPPETTYFVDYDGQPSDPAAAGHLGGIRIRKTPCAPPVAWYGGPGYPSAPPYVVVVSEPPVWPPGVCVPGAGNWGGPFGGDCGWVDGGCPWGMAPNGWCGPVVIDCQTNPDPKLCPLPPVDIALEKTVAGKPEYDEKTGLWTVTFTLVVTNAGIPFAPGAGIAITDPVPAGLTFTAATGTGWLCIPAPPLSSGNLNCRHAFGPGILATGASTSPLTVTATIKEPGKYKNCGTVGLWPGSPFHETTLANNTACAEVEVKKPPVDVAIKKTGKVEAAGGGGPVASTTLTFTLAITNVGPAFSGANVISVSDVVPAGLTFSTVTAPPDWTCTAAPIAAGGTLACTYTGTGPAAPGAALGSIVVTAVTDTAGPWENCSTVAIAPGAGTDANLDDNKSCVTLKKEGEFDDPDDPPEVPKVCGLNVIFVVDESGSVGGSAGQVNAALNNAASILNTNGAQAAVVHFSDTASVVHAMSTSTWGTISSGYSPLGGTNWEAGLKAAFSLLPGPPPATLVVFITDGVPNAALDGSGNVVYTDSVTATNEAIPVVNQLYAAGVPVMGIGIGSLSTHLNALLGGNVQMTSFGGLSGTLTSLAKQLCPSLYLTKSISPSSINFYDTPNVTQVTVTLSLTNTSGNATNVVVQDNLPAQLTNPTALVTSASPPSSAVAGDPVVWTIPAMAAGDTATLSFKVTLAPSSPIPTDGSWLCIRNFAQVTAVGTGTVNAVANNMANAETGPVHETDEASAQVCLRNYDPPDPQPCTTPYLWVKKTPLSEVCRPGPDSGMPCKFSVTVTARCTNFNGPVLFGDGMFLGSSPNPLPIASITSNPPVACTWTSGSPSTCAVSALNLPLNQTITFTVTLGAPIPAGTYKNCFVADGKTPVPVDYPGAHADVNPGTGSSGGQWGHCANFVVAEPAPAIAGCPAGLSRVDGKCVRPPPPPPPPPVVCPVGTVLRGAACVKTNACPAPRLLTPTGRCACPAGTMERGRECVPVQACAPPKTLTDRGICACPPGTRERGRECIRVPACAAPRVLTAAGACRCPEGTVDRAGRCVKPPPACARPKALNAAGECVCPAGSEPRGTTCVRPPPKPTPLRCIAPGFPDRDGTRCLCPQGMRSTGRACLPAPRRPETDPRAGSGGDPRKPNPATPSLLRP